MDLDLLLHIIEKILVEKDLVIMVSTDGKGCKTSKVIISEIKKSFGHLDTELVQVRPSNEKVIKFE